MNWQEFTDNIVGDKPTFSNKEVRSIVSKALQFVTDCWVNQTH